MNPEQIEWLRGYARKIGGKLVLDGEVGFMRQCVGIVQADSVTMPAYISYGWYGMEGDTTENQAVSAIVRQSAPADAYHKDDCLAVLGEGFAALEQLYEWCVKLDEAGLKTELVDEADLGEGSTTMSLMMTGKRAKIRRFCRDNGSTD